MSIRGVNYFMMAVCPLSSQAKGGMQMKAATERAEIAWIAQDAVSK